MKYKYIVGSENGNHFTNTYRTLKEAKTYCNMCNQYQSQQPTEQIRFVVYRITEDGVEKVQ